ncbi:MAG: ABC transporter [Ardenticatenaceae bacterium]|nr:MAG: ABC transporter [Ardenticatenaceae bacterium]
MIKVTKLTKRFGKLTAVNDLSFTVEAGEAVAFWGANGAGKTTALRCLLHLIPYQGQIAINQLDVAEQGKAVRRLVGFVPQELNFHDDMSVADTLSFYARLKKIASDHDFSPLLARLDLQTHLTKRVGDLSGGLKQRLALALALLADPPILMLDEPTANLDIRAREDFLTLLMEFKRAGKTLIFTSHRFEEITALADRVLLLEAGKLIIDAPPHQIEKQLGLESTLHLYMADLEIDPALKTLTAHKMLVSRNGRGVRVQVSPGEKGKVLRILHDADVTIDDFTIE